MIIKKAIQHEMENSPPPTPVNKAWEQLEARLNDQQPSYDRPPFYKSKLFYAFAIIFISVIIFLSPQNSGAYTKLVEVFQKVQENVTQLFVSVGGGSPLDNEIEPTDEGLIMDDNDLMYLDLSLEDAQEETLFTITEPKVVPEGYVLKDVTVLKEGNEKSDEVFLNYEANSGDFTINQSILTESFSTGILMSSDDIQIDTIDIHGRPANVMEYKDGSLELVWATENYYFSISGTLSKEELIQIAQSM